MTSASTYSEKGEPVPQAEQPPVADFGVQMEDALAHLPQRQPPAADACLLHGQLPEDVSAPITIIAQTALRQIADHAHSDVTCELGGALLGRTYRHNGRFYTEIHAAIPAVTVDHGPVHFTFTADAWSQLHKDRASSYPNLDIVGWFHTHPDLGVFYSSDDVVVHTAGFSLPWHVGLVVDPVRYEMCFFGWQAGRLVPFGGFLELCDMQPESQLTWRQVATAVWDHPYEHPMPGDRRSEVYLPPTRLPGLPRMSPYLGLVLGGLGFLLSFFLLVAWVVPLTRQVNTLQDAVLTLADEALADSNALTCPDPRVRILTPLTGSAVAVGDVVVLTGTAVHPDAARYRVSLRSAGTEGWPTDVNVLSRSTTLGELAQWDTTAVPPGAYELRLAAADRNSVPLSEAAICVIQIDVVP